ncbi:hypothetical protein WN55_00054 [Dufourea novaeangliae]|uniref:Uncharacterized protein n=1 Tax=Dufourea novaeangliae TaxID=178035 RepID=A0A154NW10_DUFNO|nr:hypothetical protein WN55_00054 [Dufourea novaeangliae]
MNPLINSPFIIDIPKIFRSIKWSGLSKSPPEISSPNSLYQLLLLALDNYLLLVTARP